jgi:hypothetical protein
MYNKSWNISLIYIIYTTDHGISLSYILYILLLLQLILEAYVEIYVTFIILAVLLYVYLFFVLWRCVCLCCDHFVLVMTLQWASGY